MRKFALLVAFALGFASVGLAQEPKTLVEGLKNPESVAVGFGNRIFVSEIGEFGKDGDGRIVEIVGGQAKPFATGLDDPKGIAIYQKAMYVADNARLWKIDEKGKAEVFVPADKFPHKPMFLNDVAVDEKGNLVVSDSGDLKGEGGALFRVDPKGKATLLADGRKQPAWKTPNGLVFDGMSFLLMLDFGTGDLWRVSATTGASVRIASGFEGGDGLAWDHFGRLFVTSWKQGKLWSIARPGAKAVEIALPCESAADLCLDPTGKHLIVPDMKAGKLLQLPASAPGAEVDQTPLALATEVAFPKLKWAEWEGVGDDGKVKAMRPIVLTHAGDGSDRVFVALQTGPIHVFKNDQAADRTEVFFDLSKKVFYLDKENEQGLLGLCFHPNYAKNGEFFVFYSLKGAKLTNVLSRFRVSKTDPNRADPASEEELFRIERPFWNHDGGTICFGPDGYLYVALGDGGAANDPHRHGQKMDSLLAKVLRIDVDKKGPKTPYAIPKDNPFVGRAEVRPEVWAYGFRNPWRIAFDRKTGQLWMGDVGQNLYEEINLVVKGGNYGWSQREGLHPFGNDGVDRNPGMIDPVWEYHHDIGKSITGGVVYRGKRLPELDGAYLYGDYISNKIWALWHDAKQGRVVANRPIADPGALIFSFGEDEPGDVYFLTSTIDGRGIRRFVRTR